MSTKNYKTSGGKRQFPPEWYAAQAARRKQRAEAKASSPAPKSSSQASTSPSSTKTAKPKAKRGKVNEVSISTMPDGESVIHIRRPYGKSKRSSTYWSDTVSKHSLARLERVLEHRRQAGTFKRRAWSESGLRGGVNTTPGSKNRKYVAK